METFIAILISPIISSIVAFFWIRGIDDMKENYPTYRGEDFLDWDDNKIHTEDLS
jgi:hypothetical protein